MPRKGRSWTDADQQKWNDAVAAGEAARQGKKVEKANGLRSARFAKDFVAAWDERVQLAREAFALRQQMDEEAKLKQIAEELAAEADALEALVLSLVPLCAAA